MWRFEFSIVTMMMLFIILAYYYFRPKLPIMSSRTFIFLNIVEILTLVLDIVSSAMDMNYELFPLWLVSLANLFYFVLFILRMYMFFSYTLSLIRFDNEKPRIIVRVARNVFEIFLVFTLASFYTGWIYRMTPEQGYVSGPYYNVIYVAFYLYLVAGFVISIRYAGKMNLSERTGFFGAYFILFVGGIVRFFASKYLIMDTFFLFTILVLFLSFQNSSLYIESRTGAFTFQSFERVVTEYVAYKRPFWFATVVPRNYTELRAIYGGRQVDKALGKIADYFNEKFPKTTIFYERGGCFIIFANSDKDKDLIYNTICERFKYHWVSENVRVHYESIYMELAAGLDIENATQFCEGLRHMLHANDPKKDIGERYVIDENAISQMEHSLAVRKALNKAVENEEVLIYIQPLVDSKTGKVVGGEALARIYDEELGMIPPGEFIPIAEQTDKIGALGAIVFEKTCEFIRDNDMESLGLSFLDINLSPAQCMNINLSESFGEVMNYYKVRPSQIYLEITEDYMIDNEILLKQMDGLIADGFTFSLDDYGSGYANSFKVKQYPFANIKLDMSIVWAHFKDPDKLLPGTIRLFKDRGLTVTAEGVETKEMAEGLVEMGCDYLQGFYYSKPLPVNQFVEFVKKHNAA